MAIIAKTENFFKSFQKLHATKPVTVDILNVANPDALPAPLTVSRRGSTSPHVNKLVVSLVNKGIDRLVVGGPTLTGIYINLSDLMSVEAMRRIKVSIVGTPVNAEIRYRQAEPETITPDELTSKDRDPTKPPPPANQHLGTDAVLYVWPEKEVEIRPQESLEITLANATSDFRPALRFLDVSWKLERRTFNGTPRTETVVEGLQQATMQLLRPADYVEPPFPLTAHWLNNNNLIYTTAADDTTTLKNTLDFAISNIGLQDFTLDCNKHSRGVPYFELVMVGKKQGETGDFSTAVADSAELVLAQIPDTTKNKDLNQLWRVNKRIQGLEVKWEIRPDLDFNFEQAKGMEGLSHKTLLGTDRNATITFRISELRSKLDDGVALVYFRYYNMPDHDDGQIVLFLEKRRISNGGNLIPQLDKFENMVASPLRWRQEKVKKEGQEVPTTTVTVGDTIKTEVSENDESTTVKTNRLPLQLKVQGNTTVYGDISIVNVGDVNSKTFQTENRRGTLKIVGAKKGSDKWRVAAIHAEADPGSDEAGSSNASTRMVFATRNEDESMSDKMVLDSKGNLLTERTHFLAGESDMREHNPQGYPQKAISAIKDITPKFYHSKANPQKAGLGFSVEEIKETLPLLLVENNYIDHPAMTALLWQGVKEMQKQLEDMNEKITALKIEILESDKERAKINSGNADKMVKFFETESNKPEDISAVRWRFTSDAQEQKNQWQRILDAEKRRISKLEAQINDLTENPDVSG